MVQIAAPFLHMLTPCAVQEPALDSFGLLIFHVEAVDYLSLKQNVHKLFTMKEDGSWDEEELNP